VLKLDRMGRSVPDAWFIADALVARGVKLALKASVCDPVDPMGKMFFNILAAFAEFEADLTRPAPARAWQSPELGTEQPTGEAQPSTVQASLG
jgi:DNA invertase Pin-like site-specific DNA recombinase